jgi:hypothetical protein
MHHGLGRLARGSVAVREPREAYMARVKAVVLVAATAACLAGQTADAAQSPAAAVKVCSLLPKAEVKKLIGGNQVFDMLEPEEEAVAGGSSCNYPSVLIQVIPYLPSTIDAARKRGPLEAVSGVGDEAYLYENPAGYAELYVKVGPRLLTL